MQRKLTWALKIEIEEIEAAVSLRQREYIDAMANKYDVADMRPFYTPMENGAPFSKLQCPKPDSDEAAYMAKVPVQCRTVDSLER